MLKTPHLGLRGKLVLLVIIGIVTSFSILGAFRLYVEKQRIMDEMMRTGQEKASLIAEAVADMLVGYDYTNMESLAERIIRQPDVLRITIRNHDGKIMVTRDKSDAAAESRLDFGSPVIFNSKPVGTVELDLTLEHARSELKSNYRNIIIAQIFSGLFLGLLIYFAASRFIVKPVRLISQHMKASLQHEEVTQPERLEISSHDEIGDLVQIFNNLNQQVFEIQQRLQEKVDLAGTALLQTYEQLQQRTAELEKRGEELEKALALVEKLALTDSLTELHNRRYFDDIFSAAFPRVQRYNESICLVLIDVDNFKQINDTLGHRAGDYVLQALGKLFKARVRESDALARLGGDEFAFLLYHSSPENAMKMASSCLAMVADHHFEFEGTPIKVGLSMGIASNVHAPHSVQDMYGAADEALYEAKRRGRNQVVTYPFALNTDMSGQLGISIGEQK